ncbi:unnamed protein product [Symbiodinium sp. CCMP2592]|nr:unnamed protein product [Symbiodinium sp. CCMP2592]
MSHELLQLAGRNAQRNRAPMRLRRWKLLRDAAPVPLPVDERGHPDYAFDLCLVDITWAGARFRQIQQGVVREEELEPTVEDILTDALRWLQRRGGCGLHAFIGHTVVHGAPATGGAAYAFDNYTAELVRDEDWADPGEEELRMAAPCRPPLAASDCQDWLRGSIGGCKRATSLPRAVQPKVARRGDRGGKKGQAAEKAVSESGQVEQLPTIQDP